MTTVTASIISALIASAASIIVCIINNNKQNALIMYRMEQLEKKVEKHNNVVDRTYKLEEHAAVQDEKINTADKRIAVLEKQNGGAA